MTQVQLLKLVDGIHMRLNLLQTLPHFPTVQLGVKQVITPVLVMLLLEYSQAMYHTLGGQAINRTRHDHITNRVIAGLNLVDEKLGIQLHLVDQCRHSHELHGSEIAHRHGNATHLKVQRFGVAVLGRVAHVEEPCAELAPDAQVGAPGGEQVNLIADPLNW
jgi:hypothetical protein